MRQTSRYIINFALMLILSMTLSSVADDVPKDARLPLEELQLFAQVFEQIRSTYVEEIDDKTLIEHAIVGLLSQLDPHSTFLQKDTYQNLHEYTTGEFGGIGIEVSMEKGFVKIISPLDDTPASKAGIKPGDLILKLDQRAVQGMALEEAIKIMRGKKGSPVTLTIARENVQKPLTFTLIRAAIKTISVREKILHDDFGYIRIAQFQANTSKEFQKSIKTLQEKASPLKGLILDLRNNSGGLLPASVDVVDALLDEGLIVYTEGRALTSNSRFSAQAGDMLKGIPIVVLINGGTASASEIVAGALQDHRRGIIIGTQSFGKGSVQNVLPLNDGRGIKLTTARYFTPSGRSIQAEGIQPDILIERTERQPKTQQSSGIKEADLNGHLSQKSEPTDKKDTGSQAAEVINDNQIFEALTLLKGLSILSSAPNVN